MKPTHKISSLAELTATILDPIMRKKAGLNIALLENWPHIVGADYADNSLPVKVLWSRRQTEVSEFEPGTLIIACEGFAALKITHETGQILNRINSFFGYQAISRIKVEQRLVGQKNIVKPVKKKLKIQEKQWLENMTDDIQDEDLRQALIELGTSVFSETIDDNKK